MEREVIRLLPYILGGTFLLGVLLFLLSLHQLRLRRTGAYWRLRRRAGDRGGKLFVLSVGLMIGSVALTLIIGLASLALKDVSDSLNRGPDDLYGIILPPESALTSTHESVSAALTATHARLETLTPPTPAPTETPIPPTATPTPSPTRTTTRTPSPSPRPTRDDSRLTPDAAAQERLTE